MTGLYGGGAVLFREITLRWGKGIATLLLLRVAYGIIEEGLMVKSFFDPAWMDLGVLGLYGRWLEVNRIWAFFLMPYHAVFSITIPIVLVELAFPHRKSDPWIGRRTFWLLALAFGFVVTFGFLFLTPYFPSASLYAVFFLLVVLLFWVGHRLPANLGLKGKSRLCRPAFWWAFGLGGSTLLFVGLYVGPVVVPHPAFLIVISMLVLMLYSEGLRRFAWMSGKGLHRLALVAEGLSPLIFLAPLMEMDASRPDNPQGMFLVGVGFALLLFFLWRRVARLEAIPRELPTAGA